MTAYYNEFDPFAAQWLRNLITAGLIAPGDVDERSIEDVNPTDLEGYTQCHFFAGIGVWSLALRAAGWADDRPVWTGSCPCQPFSAAGKGDGFADERHLWPAFHHLIAQRKPSVVFGEQVASKVGLSWFDLVRADMEGAGYACGAIDLCAASVGAPHQRQRLFFVGERIPDSPHAAAGVRERWMRALGHTVGERGRSGILEGEHARDAFASGPWVDSCVVETFGGTLRVAPSNYVSLANGSPGKLGRMRAYGNAIVPQVAQAVIESWMECSP